MSEYAAELENRRDMPGLTPHERQLVEHARMRRWARRQDGFDADDEASTTPSLDLIRITRLGELTLQQFDEEE